MGKILFLSFFVSFVSYADSISDYQKKAKFIDKKYHELDAFCAGLQLHNDLKAVCLENKEMLKSIMRANNNALVNGLSEESKEAVP